ncbi:MAG: cyclic nucleotide-binding domain-containing protein [Actinomycetota bacterium]|nr:cyclic nucleotide-binding domain-containing protein [Actinomycetota bacterium]
MGKSEAVALLKNVPLFEGLGKKELDAIYKASKEVEFKAGQVIVTEGESGAAFHLILDGTCKVSSAGRTRATLTSGDYFGEMSLIDHHPRSATVKAESDVRTLSLVSWSFMPLLDHMPQVAKKMLIVMSQRLRASEKLPTH